MPHSVTTIENGVRELEVVLPANFSDEMDIHDTGAGTGKIMAEGDEELRPTALGLPWPSSRWRERRGSLLVVDLDTDHE